MTTTREAKPNGTGAPSPADGDAADDERQAPQDDGWRRALQTRIVRDAVFPGSLAAAISPSGQVDAAIFRGYRDQLLKDAGSPSDPIEIMIIELLGLAHLQVARLQASVSCATAPEEAKAYAGAAARLTAEFRRLALGLKQYRAKPKRNLTVVQQANVAAGDQEIAFVDRSGDGENRSMKCRDSGQSGKATGSDDNAGDRFDTAGPVPDSARRA